MEAVTFEYLFRQYYQQAVLYVYSLSHDYHLSEDIASNAFCKAFTTLSGKDGRFKFWLLRVCKNAYIDVTRKKKPTSLNNDLPEDTDIADRLIQDEQFRALYRAISLLAHPYREAVELFYFQGLTLAEIAALTGRSDTLVKVTLYRARRKLKELTED